MSRLIHNNDRLIDLLDQFAMSYRQGSLDEVLLASINERLSRTTDPREFHLIAEKLWSNIAPWYDIPTMIRILRRWLEIEPNSNEAKGTLGTILLMHGPDWDEEGNRLVEDSKQRSDKEQAGSGRQLPTTPPADLDMPD